ncbi:MAG: Segregation and condensation protein B [Candidatus Uhrbacteria bacterium GW2011_GWA2_53_10]|uniref:Segregation and condensation protein B n=1 Tax=Candidatus Uhrbacteria bacterium GW2011_GWA2_53_10 TaxID=1618980 RepID=A0A0G2AL22_9BACT|nr:MAG: Segregation and condensation protein B [Candidatus Uhrbacteria bacterium GW2011_GWA2_53_10]
MISSEVEAILFATAKPLPIYALAKAFGGSSDDLRKIITELKARYNTKDSGIHLVDHEGKVQFVTNPDLQEAVASFTKQELEGELTRPQLETLTIIAYRGPITKPEIEQIRGVNCSLILRHLMVRGLIDERDDAERLQPVYTLSMDMVRHLGLHAVEELPDFEVLHSNEKINTLISETSNNETSV